MNRQERYNPCMGPASEIEMRVQLTIVGSEIELRFLKSSEAPRQVVQIFSEPQEKNTDVS